MVRLLRHRQTKGPDSARPYLNRRATPRLHLTDGVPSLNAILRQLRAALPTRTAFVGVQPEATHYRTLKTAG